MNAYTVKALRQLLFYTPEAAADAFGGVTVRAWNYYENGKRCLPSSSCVMLLSMVSWRAAELAHAAQRRAVREYRLGRCLRLAELVVIYYLNSGDFQDCTGLMPQFFSPYLSLTAELLATGLYRPVQFDRAAYDLFLAGREHSEFLLTQWAESVGVKASVGESFVA